jgi:hypothetical protein
VENGDFKSLLVRQKHLQHQVYELIEILDEIDKELALPKFNYINKKY